MEKRKKIMFMSSWYPVPENPTHGIFVQRHAAAVALLNDVCVLYVYGKESSTFFFDTRTDNGFSEHLYAYDKRGMNAFSKLKMLEKLYRQGFEKILAEWGRPDVIHLNVIFPAGIFATEFSRKHNIPLVITEHWTGYLPEDGSYKGFLKKWFTRKAVKQAAAICPVTQHLAENMKCHGLNGNYIPVPNVVDTNFFSLRERQESTETVFLHLSSFDERQKSPRMILEAFADLQKENANVKLIMAGDGEHIGALKNYADELKIQEAAISFYFRPQGAEVLRLFHQADALVLCSTYENLPVVLLEAMSCGLPLITSNVGGIKEYVNEENGILFSEVSAVALGEAMSNFLLKKNIYDKIAIRKKAIEHFSKEVISKKFSEVYDKV